MTAVAETPVQEDLVVRFIFAGGDAPDMLRRRLSAWLRGYGALLTDDHVSCAWETLHLTAVVMPQEVGWRCAVTLTGEPLARPSDGLWWSLGLFLGEWEGAGLTGKSLTIEGDPDLVARLEDRCAATDVAAQAEGELPLLLDGADGDHLLS